MKTRRLRRGFTLAETMIALTILVIAGTTITTAGSYLGFAMLESRRHTEVQDDMLLALQRIMRDCYVATNVSPHVNGTATTDHQVVLRCPVRDETGHMLEGQFEFVLYRIVETDDGAPTRGLVREVYRESEVGQGGGDPALDETAMEGLPMQERDMIMRDVDYLRFDFGGCPINEVGNLTVVGDLGIYVGAAAEVGADAQYAAETYIQIAMRNRKSLGWRIRTPPVL